MWTFEGDSYYANAPSAGACAPDTIPLHRLYNDGQGNAPNHRFTTCGNIRDRMVKNGWIYEGVSMCVAGESFDCTKDLSAGAPPGAPLAPQASE